MVEANAKFDWMYSEIRKDGINSENYLFGFRCMVKSRIWVEINNKDECNIGMVQNFAFKEICHTFLRSLIPEYNQSNAPLWKSLFESPSLAGHFEVVLRLGRYFVEMHRGNVLETPPFSRDVRSTILVFPPQKWNGSHVGVPNQSWELHFFLI